jgi:hypothetical protein
MGSNPKPNDQVSSSPAKRPVILVDSYRPDITKKRLKLKLGIEGIAFP